MRVQRVRLPTDGKVTWMVLGDDLLPVEPIQKYLSYIENLQKSPNTIQSYAYHLKLFWEFLRDSRLDWKDLPLEKRAEFIHWLRSPDPRVVYLQQQQARRTERTINTIMAAVYSFYEFQEQIGATETVDTYHYQYQSKRKYKSLLHHINKSKPVKQKLLKLKEPKAFPGTLSREQVKQLIEACNRIRDKFLICLLYETGVRIGEALGLRHEDIQSMGKSEIHVVPRNDNFNHARSKSGTQRVIHTLQELMSLYSEYLIEEYPDDIDCDYVFVNIWEGQRGSPMTYAAVDSLFRRLRKKTRINVNPHLLRHTHATELIRAGWNMAHVQRRLGHADVQTTINTYVHLTGDDMRDEYAKYLHSREEESE